MLNNNNQRLNIWLSIQNKFDYKEFTIACVNQGIDVLNISEFAQKVGMLSVAMVEYPTLKPEEAYMELVKRMNNDYTAQSGGSSSPHQTHPNSGGGCSSCGKKKNSDGGLVI